MKKLKYLFIFIFIFLTIKNVNALEGHFEGNLRLKTFEITYRDKEYIFQVDLKFKRFIILLNKNDSNLYLCTMNYADNNNNHDDFIGTIYENTYNPIDGDTFHFYDNKAKKLKDNYHNCFKQVNSEFLSTNPRTDYFDIKVNDILYIYNLEVKKEIYSSGQLILGDTIMPLKSTLNKKTYLVYYEFNGKDEYLPLNYQQISAKNYTFLNSHVLYKSGNYTRDELKPYYFILHNSNKIYINKQYDNDYEFNDNNLIIVRVSGIFSYIVNMEKIRKDFDFRHSLFKNEGYRIFKSSLDIYDDYPNNKYTNFVKDEDKRLLCLFKQNTNDPEDIRNCNYTLIPPLVPGIVGDTSNDNNAVSPLYPELPECGADIICNLKKMINDIVSFFGNFFKSSFKILFNFDENFWNNFTKDNLINISFFNDITNFYNTLKNFINEIKINDSYIIKIPDIYEPYTGKLLINNTNFDLKYTIIQTVSLNYYEFYLKFIDLISYSLFFNYLYKKTILIFKEDLGWWR